MNINIKDYNINIRFIMYKVLVVATLALSASAAITDFPAFDSFHANCAMDVTYTGKKCSVIYSEMKSTLDNYKAGDAGKGVYEYVESAQDTYFWMTRTTPVHKYVDDILFELTETDAGCGVKAKSRSRSLSYYDYSTNYCNMWNPLAHSDTFENQNVHDCKFPTDKPEETCNTY